jgi:hypothetical protein
MSVRYFMQVEPPWEPHAQYALELLFEGMGLPCLRTHDPVCADLIYSAEKPAALTGNAIWMRAEQVDDWNTPIAKVGWMGDMPCLYRTLPPAANGDGERVLAADLVYSTYALTTGVLEQGQPKDAWGAPIFENTFLQKSGLLEIPVIALYTDYLAARILGQRHVGLKQIPRWPDGKKCAVVLSHDIDTPFVRLPTNYFLRRVRSNLSRREVATTYDDLVLLAKAIARAALKPLPPDRDPNFRFQDWLQVERAIPSTSCFYVAVVTSAHPQGAPNDVTYDFCNPAMVRLMRRAIADGWEIGLHASINAKQEASRFRAEKQSLESQLGGYTVKGLRHHYWSMDAEMPERTLWSHVAAGFEYDSSFGINDVPGFRRGMAWPYQPFDRERACVVPILEVPPTLMDGGIFYRETTLDEGKQQIKAHFKQVFNLGGAAVLDWHMEQLNPTRLHGAGPALVSVLQELAGDSNIFWASPSELVAWWQFRRKQLKPHLEVEAGKGLEFSTCS